MWKSRPEVEEDTAPYYEAFNFLTNSRNVSFGGALPIPLTEIEVYARLSAIDELERLAFTKLMRRIDLEYLGLAEKRREQNKKQGETNGGIKT